MPPPDPRDFGLKPTGTATVDPAAFGLKKVSTKPGESPDNPLQEPGLNQAERQAVKYFGGNTAEAIKWLGLDPKTSGKPEVMYGPSIATPIASIMGDKSRQYDAKEYKPGHIAVRPKGTTEPWKVVDPDTGFFSSDFLRDLEDLVPEAAAVFTPGKTMLGSAAKMAGLGVAEKALSKTFGFEPTTGEVAKEAALGGFVGGAAHGIGSQLAKDLAAHPELGIGVGKAVGGLFQVPQKTIDAVTRGPEREAYEAALGREAAARAEYQGQKLAASGPLQEAQGPLSEAQLNAEKARAALAKAQLDAGFKPADETVAATVPYKEAGLKVDEARAKLAKEKLGMWSSQEAAAKAAAEKKAADIAAGKPVPKPTAPPSREAQAFMDWAPADVAPPRNALFPDDAARMVGTPETGSRFRYLPQILHPAYGIKAKYLDSVPGFVGVLKKNGIPVNSFGSQSMEFRDMLQRGLANLKSPQEAALWSQGFAADMAQWMLSPEYTALLTSAERDALTRIAGKVARPADHAAGQAAFHKILDASVPQGVRQAQSELAKAIAEQQIAKPPASKAGIDQWQRQKAYEASTRPAHRELLEADARVTMAKPAATEAELAAERALSPARQKLDQAALSRMQARAAYRRPPAALSEAPLDWAAGKAFDIYKGMRLGGIGTTAARSLAVPFRVGAFMSAGVGKAIERLSTIGPQKLANLAQKAPPGIRGILNRLAAARLTSGPGLQKALLAASRIPAVRAWLESLSEDSDE